MKSRHRKVRIISFVTALVAVLTALAVTSSLKADYYRRVAIGSARQAAANLSTSAEEMELLLQKCAVSPTDELTVMLSSQLYGTSLVTAAAIDALPWQHELEDITATIHDVELFALKCAETQIVDREKVKSLLKELSEVSDQLGEAYNTYHGAFLTFGYSPIDPYNRTADPDISSRLSAMHGKDDEIGSETQTEKQPSISESEAKEILSKAFGVDGDDFDCTIANSSIRPIYNLSGENMTVGIDGNSGKILYYSRKDSYGGENCSSEEAIQSAKDFVEKIGGGSSDIRAYRRDDGYLRCDVIMSENNVSAVDTPVKIIVDLGDGKVSGFSAMNYIFLADSLTTENNSASSQAEIAPPENAESGGGQTCIINMPWNENITCKEYIFKDDDKKYVVYYDCETGAAVDIRIITEDDSGITIK